MTPQPKPTRQLDRDYMDWIKRLSCMLLSAGEACIGNTEPHHVKPQGGGKTGSKVSDRRCVPLCRKHHVYAEKYPLIFRLSHKPEETIEFLNKEYDATHKPAPKVTRAAHPFVKLFLIRCACGLTHRIPRGKASIHLSGVTYYCAKAKAEVVAPWSVEA